MSTQTSSEMVTDAAARGDQLSLSSSGQLSTSLTSKEAGSRLKHSELKVHIQKQVTRRRNSYEAHVRQINEQVEEVCAQREHHLAKINMDFACLLEAIIKRKEELEADVNREALVRTDLLDSQKAQLLDKIRELAAIEKESEKLETVAASRQPQKLVSACESLKSSVDQAVQTHNEQDASTSWEPTARADVELDLGPDMVTAIVTRGKVFGPDQEPKKKSLFRKLSKSMGPSSSVPSESS